MSDFSRSSRYICINGRELPPPKRGVKPTIATIISEGRNSNGTVVGQRIGRDQYKIDDLEWPVLTAEDWSEILKLLKNFVVDVTFIDPEDKKRTTVKMYCGNRTAEPYYLNKDGFPTHYVNCKVNLIDMGYPTIKKEGD